MIIYEKARRINIKNINLENNLKQNEFNFIKFIENKINLNYEFFHS